MSATQGQVPSLAPSVAGRLIPAVPPHTKEDKIRIQKVEDAYFKEGRKLFDRKILEKISDILADYRAGKYANRPSPTLEIPDFVDEDKGQYIISLDLGLHNDELSFLQYFPIQRLINPYWYRIQTNSPNLPNPIKNGTGLSFPEVDTRSHSSEEFAEFVAMRNEAHERWKTNVAWRSVIEIFQRKEVKKQLKKITKIIAFGNGSPWHIFSCDKEHWDFTKYVAQHALIAGMRTHIQETFGIEVSSYAQETYYSPKDVKECLHYFGIEQTHDPDGTLKIDGETLVFAMKPNFPLLQLIADLAPAQPPIIFLDEIKRDENWQDYKDAVSLANGIIRPKKGMELNLTSPRVENFIRDYKEYSITDPDNLLRGDRTRVYVLEEGQV